MQRKDTSIEEEKASQVALVVKNPPANAEDVRNICSIQGSERSPAEGQGNALQYSCLENPRDRVSLEGYSPLGHKELDMTEATSVQFSSVAQSCPTLSNPMDCSTPGFPAITNSQSLLKLMSIESVMPFNHLILCHPLLLLPSIFPTIRVFSNESVLRIRWPKYWSFTFSISPSNKYSGLISFRMDWLDLLAIQGTLKGLLQHHSSKTSVLQCSAFFVVQLSHPYMTTGKTIALTRCTFVGKVMSLLFNMLSRLVVTLLPRSKHFSVSWLQSPSAVILEPQNIKSVTVSIVYQSICHEVMGADAMILGF